MVVLVSLARSVGEWLLTSPGGQPSLGPLPSSLLVVFAQGLGFYALGFWLFSALLALALRRRLEQTAPIAAVGLLAGVTPPLIDGLLSPGDEISYNYGAAGDWLFAAVTMPAGETLAIWLVIIATALFVLYVTRSPLRCLLTLGGGWVAMQLMVLWEVEVLGFLFGGARVEAQRILYIGVTFLVFILLRWRALWPTIVRLNHALPAGLVALAGSLWVGNDWLVSIGLALLMTAAMGIVVGHNDWYDREQDEGAGRAASLTGDDAIWLWFFYLSGSVIVLLWSPIAAWLLALYLTTAALYHLPGIRLKRIFCVAYKIEGVWGAIAFLFGSLGSPAVSTIAIDGRVMWPALLAFGGQALISGLKDYKDIEADAAAHIYTYYTLALRRGRDPVIVHRWLAGAGAAALLSAPVLLGALVGFHPLLLLGGVLALPPIAGVLLIRDRARAVETMFWFLSIYLLVLALAMRAVSPWGA